MFFINSRQSKKQSKATKSYLNTVSAEDSEPEALFLLKEGEIIKILW